MIEPRHSPLLPRRKFFIRMGWHLATGLCLIAISLAIGMSGYAWFEKMRWIDAFVNASMILSGMGPLDPIKTTAGRIFVGTYSLFSGVVFLTTVGFFLMPIVHRALHKFHLESGKVRDE